MPISLSPADAFAGAFPGGLAPAVLLAGRPVPRMGVSRCSLWERPYFAVG